MIFVFIAGTYTPFSVLLLPHTTAIVILSMVWGGALAGVAMNLITPDAPRWVGRAALRRARLGRHLRAAGHPPAGGVAALVLLLAGGVLYTVGAVFYALRWPNPWPKTFGHHEFFHACTLLAALCHHVAIYFALFACVLRWHSDHAHDGDAAPRQGGRPAGGRGPRSAADLPGHADAAAAGAWLCTPRVRARPRAVLTGPAHPGDLARGCRGPGHRAGRPLRKAGVRRLRPGSARAGSAWTTTPARC